MAKEGLEWNQRTKGSWLQEEGPVDGLCVSSVDPSFPFRFTGTVPRGNLVARMRPNRRRVSSAHAVRLPRVSQAPK